MKKFKTYDIDAEATLEYTNPEDYESKCIDIITKVITSKSKEKLKWRQIRKKNTINIYIQL